MQPTRLAWRGGSWLHHYAMFFPFKPVIRSVSESTAFLKLYRMPFACYQPTQPVSRPPLAKHMYYDKITLVKFSLPINASRFVQLDIYGKVCRSLLGIWLRTNCKNLGKWTCIWTWQFMFPFSDNEIFDIYNSMWKKVQHEYSQI